MQLLYMRVMCEKGALLFAHIYPQSQTVIQSKDPVTFFEAFGTVVFS